MTKQIVRTLVTVFITFMITENFMLSTIRISENAAGYTFTVFGTEFTQYED
ncbi:MAG: hypothetical protein MJ097_02195 [Dorea sp.]|nr:hypothetical protein [Dorea sp.]